jgi:hypothetical protein
MQVEGKWGGGKRKAIWSLRWRVDGEKLKDGPERGPFVFHVSADSVRFLCSCQRFANPCVEAVVGIAAG